MIFWHQCIQVMYRGGTNRVFGKHCFCPLSKRGRFDENGENDEFAFYPLSSSDQRKRQKWRKWWVSFRQRHGLENAGFVSHEEVLDYVCFVLLLAGRGRKTRSNARHVGMGAFAVGNIPLTVHKLLWDIYRYRPKGVLGKGVGNASKMRQKCAKIGLVLLG